MSGLYVMSPEVRWFMNLMRYKFQTRMLLRRYRIVGSGCAGSLGRTGNPPYKS